LPDQREMVANFRCNELKAEAMAMITNDVHIMKAECESKLLTDFKSKCQIIMEKAV
jgi:hypothetical protein